ncbi:MAG: PmoA family protein [Candidatus Aminicenantes bacterium]|jgi:hypothetical protein
MKITKIMTGILIGGILLAAQPAQMTFVEDTERGTLTVRDGGVNVLVYRFGDQLKKGVHRRQTRSCYIHPLYSLDGEVLTEDFPADHPHHHGLFWTWPVVRTRGQDTQTWHPANLRQYFVRWLEREVNDGAAALCVENAWKLDGEEIVAEETVTLTIHPAQKRGRAIDVELTIEAVSGPLLLRGEKESQKGYGGLSLRGAPMFKEAELTTDVGLQKGDLNDTEFLWADLSTKKCGVAIFVSPGHPGFPTTWCLRNSYAGLLNASWPGLKAAIFKAGEPVTLRYRIYIHRGNADTGLVAEAYEQFKSQKGS